MAWSNRLICEREMRKAMNPQGPPPIIFHPKQEQYLVQVRQDTHTQDRPHHMPQVAIKCSFFDVPPSLSADAAGRDTIRPHIPVRVSDAVVNGQSTQLCPLIDTGAEVNLASAAILNLLPQAKRVAGPILITDVNKNQQATLGAYEFCLSSLKDNEICKQSLPEGIRLAKSSGLSNTRIIVHVAPQFSSNMLIGYNFLKDNNAVIAAAKDNITFTVPERRADKTDNFPKTDKDKFAEYAAQSSFAAASALAPADAPTPSRRQDDIFLLTPTSEMDMVLCDVRKIEAKIITPDSMQIREGAIAYLSGGGTPFPLILNQGLATVKKNNCVDLLIKNTAAVNYVIPAEQPLIGVTCEIIEQKDMAKVSTADTQALSLVYEAGAAAAHVMPSHPNNELIKDIMKTEIRREDISVEQQLALLKKAYGYAVSTLRASGLDPPGSRSNPVRPCPPEMLKVIDEQFNDTDIDPKVKHQYRQLLIQNYDVLSKNKFDLGNAKAWMHHIDIIQEDKVSHIKQFKIPHHDQELLADMAKNLTEAGVLYRGFSPHNCPIFLVAKKDSGSRYVQDFRSCNLNSHQDRFSIRDCQESILAIGKMTRDGKRKCVFTSFDFTGAFHQLPLDKESQQHTAFTLPFLGAQFLWSKTPMGLRGASASFSKLISLIFRDLPDIVTYVDDIMCSSYSHADNLDIMQKVFKECRFHGLKINLKKSKIGQSSISWLGSNISSSGITCCYQKAEAIAALKPPETVKQIQSHLGLFQYFAHLVDKYAWISGPLTALTSQNSHWISTRRTGPLPPAAMTAWLQLRQIISSKPVLSWPNFTLPWLLFVDGAVGKPLKTPPIRGGIAAVLAQVQEGVTKPISYFSRQLRQSEVRYNAWSCEQLAVTASLEHYYNLIKGGDITVYSDHLPLVHAADPKPTDQRKTVQNLIIKMNDLNLNIQHVPGRMNPADVLSRSPCAYVVAARNAHSDVINNLVSSAAQFVANVGNGNDVITLAQWAVHQSDNSVTAALKKYCIEKAMPRNNEALKIVKAFGPQLRVDPTNNVLYYDGTGKPGLIPSSKIVVPQHMRDTIISHYHGPVTAGHFKTPTLTHTILQRYWWASIAIDCDFFVKRCPRCYLDQDRDTRKNKRPLNPWKPASYKGERVSMDLIGPFKSATENKYVLTMADHYTRYVILTPIKNKDALTVATAVLEKYILVVGPFRTVISDAGLEFCNKVMAELMKLLKMSHHQCSAYHPASNGLEERIHQSIGKYLRIYLEQAGSTLLWENFLPYIQFAINQKVNRASGTSGWLMLYNEIGCLPAHPPREPIYSETDIAHKVGLMLYAKKLTMENDTVAKEKSKKYFDKKTKDADFKPNDMVLMHRPTPLTENRKLYCPWRGPFRIVSHVGGHVFRVRKRGGRILKVHSQNLRSFDPLNDIANKDVLLSNYDLPPQFKPFGSDYPDEDSEDDDQEEHMTVDEAMEATGELPTPFAPLPNPHPVRKG